MPERQVVQGMNHRICMRGKVEGDEPQMVAAVVYPDRKAEIQPVELEGDRP
ncbi:MAG: hypothetical protein IPN51_03570 [Chloracidobacterium sp.]|nr:hypothetical protein [Chloracidobacterium sp.]